MPLVMHIKQIIFNYNRLVKEDYFISLEELQQLQVMLASRKFMCL